MAAQQKAVESTAEEILQREEHLVVTDHADLSVRVARESHSEKENHLVRESHLVKDLSVKDQKEEALVKVVREDHHSARERASVTDHADLSVKAVRENHSARKDHSVKVEKEGHHSVLELTGSHLVKDQKEDLSESALREEASVTENRQAQDSTPAARASIRKTSTISAMRSRAESTG